MSSVDMLLTHMGLGVHSMFDPVRHWHHVPMSNDIGGMTSDMIMGGYFGGNEQMPPQHEGGTPAPPGPQPGPEPEPQPGPDPEPEPEPEPPQPQPAPKPVPGIPPQYDMDYAYMSKAAYGKDADAADYLQEQGWNIDQAMSPPSTWGWDKFMSEGPLGYFEPEESNYTTFTRNGKAVVAYRGTNPANLSDLKADLAISLGMNEFSGRFREAEAAYQAAVKKYGAGNVDVTGHSLGGAEALFVARKNNAAGYVFNPGQVPWGEYFTENQVKDAIGGSSRVTTVSSNPKWQNAIPDQYKFSDDLISFSSKAYGEKLVFVPQTSGADFKTWAMNRTVFGVKNAWGMNSAHEMENFIIRREKLSKEARGAPSMPALAADVAENNSEL